MIKEIKTKRLHLDLTNNCNLDCVYCYIDHNCNGQERKMTKEDWIEIITQGVKMGITDFIISGGEPLAFQGFSEILKKLESNRAKVSLMTNLVNINKELINELIDSGAIKEIVASLDGFDGHNIARPPSRWQDAIEVIKKIKKEKKDCRVSVNTVFHKYNIEEIEKLYEVIVGLNIDIWRLGMPIKPKKLDILCDFKETLNVAAKVITNRYNHPNLQRTEIVLFKIYKSQLEGISIDSALSKSDTSLHPCQYFFGTLAIKPNGTITICSPMEFVLEKINSINDLESVIRSVEQNNFFNLRIDEIADCKSCKYALLCGSGCRADALRWTGNIKNADPISCLMMPLVEEIIIPILSENLREVYKNLIKKDGKPPKYKNLCSF